MSRHSYQTNRRSRGEAQDYTCHLCNLTFPCQCSIHYHLLMHLTEGGNTGPLRKQGNHDCMQYIKSQVLLKASGHKSLCKKYVRTSKRFSKTKRKSAVLENAKRDEAPESKKRIHQQSKKEKKIKKVKVRKYRLGRGHFVCPRCGKLYKNRISYLRHRETDCHPEPVRKKSSGADRPIDHIIAGQLKCETCSVKFEDAESLKEHVISNHHLQCDICGHVSRRFDGFNSHMRIHTGSKPFKCSTCGRAYRYRRDRNKHEKYHSKGPYPHKCNYCEKTFIKPREVRLHMRVHTGEKPHECYICGRGFACKANLVTHIRTHTQERPFECDLCDAAFAQSSAMKSHRRIHTGERPYRCDQCDYTCNQSSSLSSHKRTHLACDQSSSLSMRKHMHLPANVNIYKCSHCRFTCTSNRVLIAHKARHVIDSSVEASGTRHIPAIDNTRFRCAVCSSKFVTLEGFRYHSRTVHGEFHMDRYIVCPSTVNFESITGNKSFLHLPLLGDADQPHTFDSINHSDYQETDGAFLQRGLNMICADHSYSLGECEEPATSEQQSSPLSPSSSHQNIEPKVDTKEEKNQSLLDLFENPESLLDPDVSVKVEMINPDETNGILEQLIVDPDVTVKLESSTDEKPQTAKTLNNPDEKPEDSCHVETIVKKEETMQMVFNW